ncbi:carboxyltransferase domain-containing protein [Aliishimia ponticola]|uniref:Carboxyltransferase domain-containing protein n=1 Tax=Aliishimia ponticola TaxID=2499833 RepID=A0A4S4NE98_9RHOB|nr:carboxyltransferase domain-containing protein [Aliishimia ponticola]THH36877.1 carboxyltransferase domain-containing protein [Aliishimia ponticola]
MPDTPRIAAVGLIGLAVTFGDKMSDAANRAAIAFRAAVDAADWPEVTETASTLVSTFVAVDLIDTPFEDMQTRLQALLETRDWYAAGLPGGRKLWTLPMCFDDSRAPQIEEAARAAGLSKAEAVASLSGSRTRVITLGYAPGQPYLGTLDAAWDIPRQTDLTPRVPAGALVVAIRQFVLFTAAMPTGWRHVGQGAFRTFDPNRETPIVLTPGDEIRFAPITPAELDELERGDSLGGATWEALP